MTLCGNDDNILGLQGESENSGSFRSGGGSSRVTRRALAVQIGGRLKDKNTTITTIRAYDNIASN